MKYLRPESAQLQLHSYRGQCCFTGSFKQRITSVSQDGAWTETYLLIPVKGHVLEPTRVVPTSCEVTEVLPAVLRNKHFFFLKASQWLNRLVTILC